MATATQRDLVSEQPLSLMTIDRNHLNNKSAKRQETNASDLLTIRILEASERKLQLIRDLLGPDEWESLAQSGGGGDGGPTSSGSATTAGRPQDGRDQPVSISHHIVPTLQATNSIGNLTTGNLHQHQKQQQQQQQQNSRLSLQQNLARRREAIEFFFANPPGDREQQQQPQQEQESSALGGSRPVASQQLSLAMELRSGYYLNNSELDVEQKIIRQRFPFSLSDRLEGLLSLLGLSTCSRWRRWSEQTLSGGGGHNQLQPDHLPGAQPATAARQVDFLDQQQAGGLGSRSSLPYSSPRNVARVRRRLQADGHYERLASMAAAAAAGPNSSAGQLAVVSSPPGCSSLAGLHEEMRSKSREMQERLGSGGSRAADLRLVEPIGHFNMVQLRLPKRLRLADSKLLLAGPKTTGLGGQLELLPVLRLICRRLMPQLFASEASSKTISRKGKGGRPRQLPCEFSFDDRTLNCGQLRVQFESFQLLEHSQLMSSHEVAEMRLVQMHEAYASLWAASQRLEAKLVRLLARYNAQLSTGGHQLESSEWRSDCPLLRLLQFRLEFGKRVLASQQQLIRCWNELQSLRAELMGPASSAQSRLTTAPMEVGPNGLGPLEVNERFKQLVEQLIGRIAAAYDEAAGEPPGVGRQLLAEIRRLVGADVSSQIRVKLVLEMGGHSKSTALDESEARRRSELASLMASFRLKVLVVTACNSRHARSYQADLPPLPGGAPSDRVGQSIDLSSLEPLEVILAHDDDDNGPVQVEVQLHQKCSGQRFKQKLRLLAKGQLVVEPQTLTTAPKTARHKLELVFGASPGGPGELATTPTPTAAPPSARALLVLRTSMVRRGGAHRGPNRWSIRQRQLVDHLHRQCFEATHPFDDTASKLARLLNRVDTSLLLSFFHWPALPGLTRANNSSNNKDTKDLRLAYFQLEPHCGPMVMWCDKKVLEDSATAGLDRLSLLARRWANQVDSHTVYLSDRENYRRHYATAVPSQATAVDPHQHHDQQRRGPAVDAVDGELRSRLRSQAIRLELGYKSVEALGACSVAHIRRCELNIERRLELRAQRAASERQPASWRAADLLLEARLVRPIDVGSLARQLIWWLKPRRTARRPLMARSRTRPPSYHHRWPLRAVKQGSLGLRGPGLSSSAAHGHLDLESQTMAHWHRFAVGLKQSRTTTTTAAPAEPATITPTATVAKSNLQLVVTVQQASNVPMRVVSNQQQQQQLQQLQRQQLLLRSESPFGPDLGGFGAGRGGGGGLHRQHGNCLLLPPTTYVELVFQRKQLATSLAQGKHPAWNETLFFAVDSAIGNSRAAASSSPRAADLLLAGEPVGPPEGQLADEHLQVNLYDCRCYQWPQRAGDQVPNTTTTTTTTMQLAGPLAGPLGNLGQQPANRLLTVSQRIERHLIGSLRLPLAGLLSTRGRLEGSFALNQPLLLDTSYQFEPDPMLAGAGTSGAAAAAAATTPMSRQLSDNRPTNRTTHISLLVTLDPPPPLLLQQSAASNLTELQPWQQQHLALDSVEHDQVLEYARLWEQVMLGLRRFVFASHRSPGKSAASSSLSLGGTSMGPGGAGQTSGQLSGSRHVRALVLRGREAKYCLVSRCLQPTRPPAQFELLRATVAAAGAAATQGEPTPASEQEAEPIGHQMARLARFVSLLSPLKYGLFERRSLAPNVWFDSRDLLDKRLGGPEEKAVLLCNYFAHLGQCCGLLMGDSLPAGRCVLVIVWRSSSSNQSRLLADEQRLELQVSSLMDQLLVGSGGGGNDSASQQGRATGQQSANIIEASNFIARMPILIGPRTVQIWDPNTGHCYSLDGCAQSPQGPQLQLTSVGSIVTMENVYANAQASELPAEMNFDIRLKQFWLPLFEDTQPRLLAAGAGQPARETSLRMYKKIVQQTNWRKQLAQLETIRRSLGPHPLKSAAAAGRGLVPPVELSYETFTSRQCEELKQALDRAIRSHLLAWRPNRPTYFNRTLSRLLADKLATFEAATVAALAATEPTTTTTTTTTTADWRTQLAELIRDEVLTGVAPATAAAPTGPSGPPTMQVISWPVNVSFTSVGGILDALYASGVHNADLLLDSQQQVSSDPQSRSGRIHTQFLVACHVVAYPARVMSVWLYVGAIVAQPPLGDGLSASNNLLI